MKKLPVLVVGSAMVIASCAPVAANRLAESLTPTAPPPVPTETQQPAAPTETQAPPATTNRQEATGTAASETLGTEGVIAAAPSGRNFQPQLEQISINMNEVVTLLPPDAIPAVLPDRVQEIMVTAADADAAGIDPSVQVMGVEINGQSRAYPVPFMSSHEIVNDEVGGRLIAATW